MWECSVQSKFPHPVAALPGGAASAACGQGQSHGQGAPAHEEVAGWLPRALSVARMPGPQ